MSINNNTSFQASLLSSHNTTGGVNQNTSQTVDLLLNNFIQQSLSSTPSTNNSMATTSIHPITNNNTHPAAISQEPPHHQTNNSMATTSNPLITNNNTRPAAISQEPPHHQTNNSIATTSNPPITNDNPHQTFVWIRPSNHEINIPKVNDPEIAQLSMKKTQECERSLQTTISSTGELLHMPGVKLSENQINLLKELEDNCKAMRGRDLLDDSQKLNLIEGPETAADAARLAAISLADEPQQASNTNPSTSKVMNRVVRTAANMGLAISSTLYAQAALKEGKFIPISLSGLSLVAVPALITASTLAVGEEKTDKMIQTVQDGVLAVKDKAVQVGIAAKNLVLDHPYITTALATATVVLAGSLLSHQKELDSHSLMNAPQKIIEENGPDIAEKIIEQAVTNYHPQMKTPSIEPSQSQTGVGVDIQGTILPSIAALAVKVGKISREGCQAFTKAVKNSPPGTAIDLLHAHASYL